MSMTKGDAPPGGLFGKNADAPVGRAFQEGEDAECGMRSGEWGVRSGEWLWGKRGRTERNGEGEDGS
ncbi:MAG: hypothetical protein O3A92_15730, partial [Verrucomicrobia bacterium]|nr:hypothetical protein [Verrucomicrobiota bacterium]